MATSPAPTSPQATVIRPGYGLGIAGFITSFFFSLPGMIMSIIAFNQSKRAGLPNGLALAGIIIGAVGSVAGLIVAALIIIGIMAGAGDPSLMTY